MTSDGFKFDRDFGLAYNCRYGRYGPTSPGPLVLFLPLYALAYLWASAIRRWRLILSLALLALVGCLASPPVSPVATPDTWRPVPLVDFSRVGTGGYRTTSATMNLTPMAGNSSSAGRSQRHTCFICPSSGGGGDRRP